MKHSNSSDFNIIPIKEAFRNLFSYIFGGASFLVLCGFLSEQSRLHFLGLNKIVSTSVEDYTIEGVEFFAKHILFLFFCCIPVSILLFAYHSIFSICRFNNAWSCIESKITKNKVNIAVVFILSFIFIFCLGCCIYICYVSKLLILDSILLKDIKMPYADNQGTRFYIAFLMFSALYFILIVSFMNYFKRILVANNVYLKTAQIYFYASLIFLLALFPSVFSRTMSQNSFPMVDSILFSETFGNNSVKRDFYESTKNNKLFIIDKNSEEIVFYIKGQKRLFVIRSSEINFMSLMSAKKIF